MGLDASREASESPRIKKPGIVACFGTILEEALEVAEAQRADYLVNGSEHSGVTHSGGFDYVGQAMVDKANRKVDRLGDDFLRVKRLLSNWDDAKLSAIGLHSLVATVEKVSGKTQTTFIIEGRTSAIVHYPACADDQETIEIMVVHENSEIAKALKGHVDGDVVTVGPGGLQLEISHFE